MYNIFYMTEYVDPSTEISVKKKMDDYIASIRGDPNLDKSHEGTNIQFKGYYIPPKLNKEKKPKILYFKKTENGFDLRVTN